MFTTLVAVLVALALGHVAPAAAVALRGFGFYRRWLQWLDAHAAENGFWRSRQGWVLAVLPWVLGVLLLQWALHGRVFGLPSLLLGVAILVICWGPRDLDRDVEAVIDADDAPTRHAAIAQLQSAGGSLHEDVSSLVEATVLNGLRRWFAVLFWFLLLARWAPSRTGCWPCWRLGRCVRWPRSTPWSAHGWCWAGWNGRWPS